MIFLYNKQNDFSCDSSRFYLLYVMSRNEQENENFQGGRNELTKENAEDV